MKGNIPACVCVHKTDTAKLNPFFMGQRSDLMFDQMCFLHLFQMMKCVNKCESVNENEQKLNALKHSRAL